jgi:hypothetical protein
LLFLGKGLGFLCFLLSLFSLCFSSLIFFISFLLLEGEFSLCVINSFSFCSSCGRRGCYSKSKRQSR